MAVDVVTDDFKEVVEKSSVPVLVDFWAPWCGPCRQMAPILDRAQAAWGDSVKLAKVNVDENPDISQRFGIMGIPTMILFRDGAEVGRLTGARSEQRLMDEISRLLG